MFVNLLANSMDKAKKDSILASPPAHIITVQDAANKKSVVKMYLKEIDQVADPDTTQPGWQYDVDNMYALVNDGKDFVVVQYFVFGKVLQTPQYFLRKRQPGVGN